MNRAHGFTLLELLVAIALFAVLAGMAYGSLDSLSRGSMQLQQAGARLAAIQRAIDLMARDLRQSGHRGVRDAYGRPLAPIAGAPQGLELTRAGYANALAQPRAELQRVGWRREGETLQRLHHPSLDRAGAPPRVDDLLQGVQALELRYLDSDGREHDRWPPPRVPAEELPRAIEVRLVLEDYGALRRLLELPVPGPAR